MGGKRLDLKTGFVCNNSCRFCVQAHKKHLGNLPTAEVKEKISKARANCEDIVFTGGEVTIRPDLFDLVGYARDIGYGIIQIQSNCRMLSNMGFTKKLIASGANEFSPAVHGHNPNVHDFLTRSPGSFRQTIQAIKNLRLLDQKIITNSVVVKPNYKHLPEIAKLLVKLGVDQFQFAFVHPIGNAHKYYDEMVPKMSLVAPYVHRGLQIGIDAGINVMAEGMPYCMMHGFEDYVSERFIPETKIIDFDVVVDDYKYTRVKEGKSKFSQCRECKYDNMCEGPWKEYPEKFGDKEFRAIKE